MGPEQTAESARTAANTFPRRWVERSFPPVGEGDVKMRAWIMVNMCEDGVDLTPRRQPMSLAQLYRRLLELKAEMPL